MSVHCCIGGTDTKVDKKVLKDGGTQVIIGTPGRVKDMIVKNFLKTEHLKIIVLDEADEMLDRGFVEEVKEIFAYLPSDIQVCLFSATMPPRNTFH